jgi:hypothetical protein
MRRRACIRGMNHTCKYLGALIQTGSSPTVDDNEQETLYELSSHKRTFTFDLGLAEVALIGMVAPAYRFLPCISFTEAERMGQEKQMYAFETE